MCKKLIALHIPINNQNIEIENDINSIKSLYSWKLSIYF